MDRSFSAKVARILLIRRAKKKIEAEDERLKFEIIDHMAANDIEQYGVPSGVVTYYDEKVEDIDPVKLFNKYGKKALAVMKVKIGDARRLFGEGDLRADRLIIHRGKREKLLTKPAPKKKTCKVAC